MTYSKLAAERNTLFVGSLPPEVNEEELKEIVHTMVGPVVNVELKRGPPPNFISRRRSISFR